MEVDSEAGLRCGACLTVNTLADTEPADTDDYHHDEDMAQLTGNMYVLTVSLLVYSRVFPLLKCLVNYLQYNTIQYNIHLMELMTSTHYSKNMI